MRMLFLCLALAGLAACSRGGDAESACSYVARHELAFSSPDAPDAAIARAEGPSCAQAVATLTLRDAQGDLLWALAKPYYDLTVGGAAPEGAPEPSADEVEAFLAAWADLTIMRSSALPAWPEGAASLAEASDIFAYETPFDRETYERLRALDLPQVCYAIAAEASECLIMDPASNAPAIIVRFGP